jgi:hypothetical protein
VSRFRIAVTAAPGLAGKRNTILPDNDPPSPEYAERNATSLRANAESLKVVPLPGLAKKQDIIDWAKVAGNDKAKLIELIKAAGEWQAPPSQESGEPPPEENNANQAARLTVTDLLKETGLLGLSEGADPESIENCLRSLSEKLKGADSLRLVAIRDAVIEISRRSTLHCLQSLLTLL